jgi:hypothetical protein
VLVDSVEIYSCVFITDICNPIEHNGVVSPEIQQKKSEYFAIRSFAICTLHQNYSDEQIIKDETEAACSMYRLKERCLPIFGFVT